VEITTEQMTGCRDKRPWSLKLTETTPGTDCAALFPSLMRIGTYSETFVGTRSLVVKCICLWWLSVSVSQALESSLLVLAMATFPSS
jgi:hypothetical protein